jgi:hypothetical protein
VTMWRSTWSCVIKPAYSLSFLLSINSFVWQNVLYFPNDLRISFMWCNVIYCFRRIGDLNVCVIWDNIFLKTLLIKANVCMAVKYFLFNILIFIEVFGLNSNKNFNVTHSVVYCIKKDMKHSCEDEI